MTYKPEVAQSDIDDVERIVSDLFIKNPQNPDGSRKQQTVFSDHESEMIVSTVLNELSRRGYSIMKPKQVGPNPPLP